MERVAGPSGGARWDAHSSQGRREDWEGGGGGEGEWDARLQQARLEQERWEGQGEQSDAVRTDWTPWSDSDGQWQEQEHGGQWEGAEKGPRAGPVNIVFFHIETTGQTEPVRPLHIGAVDSWGEDEFDMYVWPGRDIETGHSELFTEGGQMFRTWHEGEPLPCQPLEAALVAFMAWLAEVQGSVVLVAHGCHHDQGKVLLRNLEEFQIPWEGTVTGFTDSRVAAERTVPGAAEHGLDGVRRALELGGGESHDAVERAEDTRMVCRALATRCRMKFLEFVTDTDWSVGGEQQWEWAFE
jgi:hypothetical protein